MKNMETLKELIGAEMNLVELDNKMESLGFRSIFDEVDETTLKNNGSASYLIPETETDYVNIEFDVDGDIIKITAVEEI